MKHETLKGKQYVKKSKIVLASGNVIDLAVGVVIASAFGAIVTSLVNDIITPLILNPALKLLKLNVSLNFLGMESAMVTS